MTCMWVAVNHSLQTVLCLYYRQVNWHICKHVIKLFSKNISEKKVKDFPLPFRQPLPCLPITPKKNLKDPNNLFTNIEPVSLNLNVFYVQFLLTVPIFFTASFIFVSLLYKFPYSGSVIRFYFLFLFLKLVFFY